MRYNRGDIDSALHAAERLAQKLPFKKRYVYATAGGFGVYDSPPLASYQSYYETTGYSTIYHERNADGVRNMRDKMMGCGFVSRRFLMRFVDSWRYEAARVWHTED